VVGAGSTAERDTVALVLLEKLEASRAKRLEFKSEIPRPQHHADPESCGDVVCRSHTPDLVDEIDRQPVEFGLKLSHRDGVGSDDIKVAQHKIPPSFELVNRFDVAPRMGGGDSIEVGRSPRSEPVPRDEAERMSPCVEIERGIDPPTSAVRGQHAMCGEIHQATSFRTRGG